MPQPRTGPKYIRNVRYVQASIRLGSGRRIHLQPRGVRGDCAPVNKDEMNDEIFLANSGILYEIITSSEAKKVVEKQTINQQSAHPALRGLRNALGEELEDKGVVIEESNVDQGKKAGSVDERGMITRFHAVGSVDKPLPDVPDHVPPEEQADWLARNTKNEGPEAGLAGRKIVMEQPTIDKGNE